MQDTQHLTGSEQRLAVLRHPRTCTFRRPTPTWAAFCRTATAWHEICFLESAMEKQTLKSARGSLVNRAETVLRQRWNNLQERGRNSAPDWKDLSADLKLYASRGEISVDVEAAALGRIRRSLERIERGTYGKCVVCGGEIETERLRAIPDVERCAGCTH